jgi:predicted porin
MMKNVRTTLFVLLMVSLCIPYTIHAAPPVVLGDAEVVPYQHWEFWLSSTYKKVEDKKALAIPTIEAVYGLLPRVELSLETTYISEKENGDTVEGIDAVATQAKLLIVEEKDDRPQATVSLQYEVPTGGEKERLEWSDNVWAPSFAVQKHFGNVLVISQIKNFIDNKWRYGVDVFYKAAKGLKLLGEVYAVDYLHSEKKNELNFRLGFKYNFLENAKVYAAAGRSILKAEKNRPELEANAGIMVEF